MGLVRLADVARKAGCSVNTASRALNGKPDVSPATRSRVQATARRLGYVPNGLAKSLVTRHTNTIGLILTDLLYPNSVTLATAVDELTGARGYHVLQSSTNEDVARERRAIEVLLERRVEGILLVPAGTEDRHPGVLTDRRIPVVLLLRNPYGPGIDFVGSNEAAAGAEAVRHLLRLGHRRIGFLREERPIVTVAARVEGSRSALAAAGIEPRPEWDVSVPFSAEGAYHGTRALVRLRERPTALLLQSDLLAPGVFAAAREAGLAVPGDLALVGSGDHYFAPFLETPLTTIRRPVADIAAAAVGLLFTRIADPGGDPRQITLPSTLVVRRSCGAPAATPVMEAPGEPVDHVQP
jgi:LacI family transcriptional regulator